MSIPTLGEVFTRFILGLPLAIITLLWLAELHPNRNK